MRFGAPLLDSYSSPDEWVDCLKKRGYGAANSPLSLSATDAEAIAYGKAAKAANIVIAEQGAWGVNCLSYDKSQRDKAIAACIRGLELAELLGARCCVALSGSRDEKWDAPHKDNFSKASFDRVVENTRIIIDAVQPKVTFFTLEPMPWTLPYDSRSQLLLLEAVDRKAYAVHYDPVNMVYSPNRYYDSGSFIRDYIGALGASIRVCHAKDVQLLDAYVLQLHERIPGEGELDYDALLTSLAALDADLPVMPEHLHTQEEYDKAEAFIRGRADALGLSFVG